MIEAFLNAEVEIQQNDVGIGQAHVGDGSRRSLRFPKNGHARAVLEQHSQTGANNGVVFDDGDSYGSGVRQDFLLSLGGESCYFHGAGFIPINVVLCKAQKFMSHDRFLDRAPVFGPDTCCRFLLLLAMMLVPFRGRSSVG